MEKMKGGLGKNEYNILMLLKKYGLMNWITTSRATRALGMNGSQFRGSAKRLIKRGYLESKKVGNKLQWTITLKGKMWDPTKTTKKVKSDSKGWKKLVEQQIASNDWTYLSKNYDNIKGLTDVEIEGFIENKINNSIYKDSTRRELNDYIKHIKCYDQEELKAVSKKAFDEFKEKTKSSYNINTIFITSPRGGFDILADFGYANDLSKSNFPYDLEKRSEPFVGDVLTTRAMPYGARIGKVEDIVFLDDIYMSGEQERKGYIELKRRMKEMNLDVEPRLHYIAMTGNKEQIEQRKDEYNPSNWHSFTVGDIHSFKKDNEDKYKEISAIVFPFSIPDGTRHGHARELYGKKKRFKHRSY